MEGEIYVDPDEDEVFFMAVATQAQRELVAKRRGRKTMVFRPMVENKENVSANIPKTICPNKKNLSYREALDDDEQGEHESTHNTTPTGDSEDNACLDQEDDLDLLFMDCVVNESLVSWASVDVNTELESLVTNMENLLDDEDDDAADTFFNSSSTPKKSEESFNLLTTPKMTLKADNDGGYLSALSEAAVAISRENVMPKVVITEPTPDQEGEKSPVAFASTQTKIRRPLKLVYRNDEESSSSSGSYKSVNTPASCASFRKPTTANIPKSSGLKAKMTPVSKIPRGISKLSASKSLEFQHIESPVSKYIHQKSTPLVCNVKSQKKSWIVQDLAKKEESALKGHMPELPAARYQKGVPLKQDKLEDSKLPRLGPVQMNKIKPLSPRVVKHQSRVCDVSVLLSCEAKMPKTPKK